MTTDDRGTKRPPKRFALLLFTSFLAALIAEPHGYYGDTAMGMWSPIILAVIPAIVVASIGWAIIRRSDPADFKLLSFPTASIIAVIGLLFFWVRKDQAVESGASSDQAAAYVLFSPAGLTLGIGIFLLCLLVFRKNREKSDA